LSPWSRSNNRVKRFTLYTVFISLMQQLGATSPTLQRVLIHSIQPFLVSAFFLVLVVFRDHPWYAVIVAPFTVYLIYRVHDDYRREQLERKDAGVHPDKLGPVDGNVPLTEIKHLPSEDCHDPALPRHASSRGSSDGSRNSSIHPGDDVACELPVVNAAPKSTQMVKVSGALSSSDDECKDADVDSSDIEVNCVNGHANDSDSSLEIIVINKRTHVSSTNKKQADVAAPARTPVQSDALVDVTSEDDIEYRGIGNISDTDSSVDVVSGKVREIVPLSALSESEDIDLDEVRGPKKV
jgi:hypothetical protein